MKRYKAILKARKGLLLAGVKVQESSWFELDGTAQMLLTSYVKENDLAGRKHDGGKVVSRWSKKELEKKGRK